MLCHRAPGRVIAVARAVTASQPGRLCVCGTAKGDVDRRGYEPCFQNVAALSSADKIWRPYGDPRASGTPVQDRSEGHDSAAECADRADQGRSARPRAAQSADMAA